MTAVAMVGRERDDLGPRLLRIPVRCPTCNRPPAIRFDEAVRACFAGSNPEQVVLTYQCGARVERGRTCGTVYEITVRALLRAS